MKPGNLLIVIAVSSALFLSGRGYGQMGMMQGCPMMNMSMTRHRYVMQHGIGSKYASKLNPLRSSPENVETGRELYKTYCASCHGPTGLGNGELGKALNPPATNIASFAKMPMASNGYLYWSIAEGGVPLKTPMPAFKRVLTEKNIWEIIIFLRKF